MIGELVDVFARPVRARLAALAADEALVATIRAELEVAALSFGAYAQQQAKQADALWGTAFARTADALTADLRGTATTLAAGTALVDRAALAVHIRQSAIRELLAEFLADAEWQLAEALAQAENGRYDAVITASGRLAEAADVVARQAETAYRAAHDGLTTAARQLTGLAASLPEPV